MGAIGAILTHWRVLLVIVIGVGVFAYLETLRVDLNEARMRVQTIQTAQVKAVNDALERNRTLGVQHDQETQALAENYARTVAAIKGSAGAGSGIVCRGSPRMRYPGQGIHRYPLPSPTSATPGPASTSPDSVASGRVARLPQDCAVTTAGYLALQRFAIQECGAR